MTELYKKGVWRDKKISNSIANCVFNDYARVSLIANMYMIENTIEFAQNFESSEEEDEFENAHNEKEKQKHRKISKKKEQRLENDLKRAKRRVKRRNKTLFSTNSFLIDDIYNAQEFTDKLFVKLQKGGNLRFNHK